MPPPAPGAYNVVPRVIRTEFVSRWESRPDEAADESEQPATPRSWPPWARAGHHEILPFTGQTAGLIRDVQPAAKIVKNLVAEAERVVELG